MFIFIINSEENYEYGLNFYVVLSNVTSFHNAYTQKG